MKRFNLITLVILTAILALGATGCRRKAKQLTTIPNTSRTTIRDNSGPNFGGLPDGNGIRRDNPRIGETDTEGTAQPSDGPLTGEPDREFFKAYTVYFDFDKHNLADGEKGKVEAVATELKKLNNAKLIIEGHCDERGTTEYNRALGSRRGLSVREYLLSLGISAENVEVVSMGEEAPAIQGTSDADYAKNRRAEFILLR